MTPELSALVGQVIIVLSPAVLALVTWLVARATTYLQAKTKNVVLAGIFTRLQHTAITVVQELDQTVVAALKEKAADGKLTPDEVKQVGAEALAKLRTHLGVKGLGEVATVLGLDDGGVQSLLVSHLEAAVAGNRGKAEVASPLSR